MQAAGRIEAAIARRAPRRGRVAIEGGCEGGAERGVLGGPGRPSDDHKIFTSGVFVRVHGVSGIVFCWDVAYGACTAWVSR